MSTGFAPTLRRGYSASGRRSHALPLWLWRSLTFSMLTRSLRSGAQDAMDVLAAWPEPPTVAGAAHIPTKGPMALIANHYQRRGMWIGFPAGLLAREIMHHRPDRASVHYGVIADLRIGERRVPGSTWAFGRVAAVWGLVPLPTAATDGSGRAAAIRTLLSLALPPPRGLGRPIGIFPEGSAGSTAGLRQALPGTGSLLLLLCRGGVPILPVAAWEAGGRLQARFGPPFSLHTPPAGLTGGELDHWARDQAMGRLAALLPSHLRGVYATPWSGADSQWTGEVNP